jgi:hypothetical protein
MIGGSVGRSKAELWSGMRQLESSHTDELEITMCAPADPDM